MPVAPLVTKLLFILPIELSDMARGSLLSRLFLVLTEMQQFLISAASCDCCYLSIPPLGRQKGGRSCWKGAVTAAEHPRLRLKCSQLCLGLCLWASISLQAVSWCYSILALRQTRCGWRALLRRDLRWLQLETALYPQPGLGWRPPKGGEGGRLDGAQQLCAGNLSAASSAARRLLLPPPLLCALSLFPHLPFIPRT